MYIYAVVYHTEDSLLSVPKAGTSQNDHFPVLNDFFMCDFCYLSGLSFVSTFFKMVFGS